MSVPSLHVTKFCKVAVFHFIFLAGLFISVPLSLADTIPVTGISINKEATNIFIGGSEQLIATVVPALASNKNVTWLSQSPEVATVSAAGLVTSFSTGKTTITVTTGDGGKVAACVVIVSAVPLNVTTFGVIGDETTDNGAALDTAIIAARTAGRDLYFPNGTYLYNGVMDGGGVRFYGQSREGTIITSSAFEEHCFDGAENITFRDFALTDYGTSLSRIFRKCRFVSTLTNQTSLYMFYAGFYTNGADFEITECDFVFNSIYSALWIRKYNSVLIKDCTFNGNAWHNIRLSEPNRPNAPSRIINNSITGGTTGIFIGSDRSAPIEGGIIEGNTLFNQMEESISLDGLGNNPGLISVIANGPITSVNNDANGRIVISMEGMLYHDGVTPDVPSPVSLRNDWTNFYFSFGEGSGLEGTLVKIYSFDAAANTLTLDLRTPASAIKTGGDGGVQGGFFNWTIRGNTISGALGYNNTYAVAISVYLNVFGTIIENNIVYGSAHGISLAGGQMLTTYRTLAYNNTIKGNTFINCDQNAVGEPSEEVGVVGFLSYWGGGGPIQYNNKFINNRVEGGRLFIERQENFTFEGNTLINVTAAITMPDSTLPAVTAFAIPVSVTTLTMPVTTFAVSDNIAVVGHIITESATAPEANNADWTSAIPSSYTFTTGGYKTLYAYARDAKGNVSAGRSAATVVILPQTLTVAVSGNGVVHSAPAGISCTGSGSGCTATFDGGTAIKLIAAEPALSHFVGWNVGCTGNSLNCLITIWDNTAVTAGFTSLLPVQLVTPTATTSHGSLTEACAAAPAGSSITLRAMSGDFEESLELTRKITATLSGGWNSTFSAVSGTSALHGPLTIRSGRLNVGKLIIW